MLYTIRNLTTFYLVKLTNKRMITTAKNTAKFDHIKTFNKTNFISFVFQSSLSFSNFVFFYRLDMTESLLSYSFVSRFVQRFLVQNVAPFFLYFPCYFVSFFLSDCHYVSKSTKLWLSEKITQLPRDSPFTVTSSEFLEMRLSIMITLQHLYRIAISKFNLSSLQ